MIRPLLEAALTEDQRQQRRIEYLTKRYSSQVDPGIIKFIVEKADPKHGPYSEWILKQLVKLSPKDIERWVREDFDKTHEDLLVFDRSKHLLPVQARDINKLSSVSLWRVAEELRNREEDESGDSAKNQVTRLFDDEDLLVLIPLTSESASLYGRGTRWCTTNPHNFAYYNKRGPLYIIIDRKTNRKWQYHAEGNQLMDELDEPTPPTSLPEKAYRVLADIGTSHKSFAMMRTFGAGEGAWRQVLSTLDAESFKRVARSQEVPAWALAMAFWERPDRTTFNSGFGVSLNWETIFPDGRVVIISSGISKRDGLAAFSNLFKKSAYGNPHHILEAYEDSSLYDGHREDFSWAVSRDNFEEILKVSGHQIEPNLDPQETLQRLESDWPELTETLGRASEEAVRKVSSSNFRRKVTEIIESFFLCDEVDLEGSIVWSSEKSFLTAMQSLQVPEPLVLGSIFYTTVFGKPDKELPYPFDYNLDKAKEVFNKELSRLIGEGSLL